MTPRTVCASLACLLLPAGVCAQTVRGTVVDERDARPIVGAVVLLLDSAGDVSGRALSDDAGEFRLTAARAGTYRLRALRIGFSPVTTASVVLATGGESVQRLRLASIPVSLAAIAVQGRSTCRLGADSALGTFTIWEQARTALTAADLASRTDNMYVRLVTFERAIDSFRRVRRQTAVLHSGASSKPWISRSPAQLRENGYAVQTNGLIQYVAPDLDVLLSPEFVEDHCFRVVRSRDASLVGLGFEPTKERRRIPDIKGTLWVDRNSAELRRLEFQYTNLQRPAGSPDVRGEIEFVRMKRGGWWISQWSIDVPVVVRDELAPQGPIERAQMGPPLRLAETRITGGELVLVAQRGDTLWSRPPQALSGVLLDASSGRPLAGAEIGIPALNVASPTDAEGRFRFDAVIPGEYAVEVRRSGADTLETPWQYALAFTGMDDTLRLRAPVAHVVAQAPPPVRGTFVGRVLSQPEGRALDAAEVRIVDLDLSTRADSTGRFQIGNVPPGSHVVAARALGYTASATTLHFGDTATVVHTFHLDHVQVLDTVAVAERRTAVLEFEERRRLGIGHFISRGDLERAEYRRLGDVLSNIPGLRVFRAPGGQGWVMNGRRPTGTTTLDSFSRSQGARPGCYADVWLDGLPVYVGSRPGMLFDVNTVIPATLEGVEYYASIAQTPIKFARFDNQCGVLVLWSRIGP